MSFPRPSGTSLALLCLAVFFGFLVLTDGDNPGQAAAAAAQAEVRAQAALKESTRSATQQLTARKLEECANDPRCAGYDVVTQTWRWKDDASIQVKQP